MEQKIDGPFAYQNWKASLSGKPWQKITEYPLFTDAHITSKNITKEFGPFQLINGFSLSSHRPAIILRVCEYLQYELTDMNKTQDKNYHGGFERDELAALVSLSLGIRLKAGGASRVFGKGADSMGTPYDTGDVDPTPPVKRSRPFLKNASGVHSLEDANILSLFPKLSSKSASALVRAARMYQEAVWIIDATPELSWIMLTSAVETVAQHWEKKGSSVKRLIKYKSDLVSILTKYAKEGQEDNLIREVAQDISGIVGSTAKFIDFILEFLPPPPPSRPNELVQLSWEKSAIKDTLNTVYNYRSKALHDGKPFPAPMCQPPQFVGEKEVAEEIPIGLSAEMKGSVWVAKDTPILLHTFEYIARNAILNWWEQTATGVKKDLSIQ